LLESKKIIASRKRVVLAAKVAVFLVMAAVLAIYGLVVYFQHRSKDPDKFLQLQIK
jgi:hypothetical protein